MNLQPLLDEFPTYLEENRLASPQNQAFNALLFLFPMALKISQRNCSYHPDAELGRGAPRSSS